MKHLGYHRVAAAIPQIKVGNCAYNTDQIIELTKQAVEHGVEVVVFPELCITGYTCGDLFFQNDLLQNAENAVKELVSFSNSCEPGMAGNIILIVGCPIKFNNKLYDCAIVIQTGKIIGIVPKQFLPNYGEFYEKRWFAVGKPQEQTAHSLLENIVFAEQKTVLGTNILFQKNDEINIEHQDISRKKTEHFSFKFGIEICEDLWSVVPPSSTLCLNGAQMIFNLSASNELTGKQVYRKSLVEQQSARCNCAYIYAGAGFGESSTDLVFAGNGFIYENGKCLAEAKRFSLENQLIIADIDVECIDSERIRNTTFSPKFNDNIIVRECQKDILEENFLPLCRNISPTPFVLNDDGCWEAFNIQTNGLLKRIKHINGKSLVIGVSGGLDSTLALLVCVNALKHLATPTKTDTILSTPTPITSTSPKIIAVSMPGYGTSDRTFNNTQKLVQLLKDDGINIEYREINIVAACEQHFKDIESFSKTDNTKKAERPSDIVFQNSQARERTQILMDIANQTNGIVIGTGDMSELALGWCTYNGDQMSMYGVNSGVPKTLVKRIVKWYAECFVNEFSTEKSISKEAKLSSLSEVLLDIIDTPISPELLPTNKDGSIGQITEEEIGPYELHDFFLYYTLRYGFSKKKILFLAEQAFIPEEEKSNTSENKIKEQAYSSEIIEKWFNVFYKRFYSQQYKRSCMPDGPKIGSVNLSPRGDWRMPSDVSVL
ncbi:NAD(+) synthase [Bacteroidia bacterium]|nr:NAD(+) synthase [Bacteroidia bacterium]